VAHGRGFFGIRKAGLKELRKQRMGDPLKIELAGELRKQTAVSMGGDCEGTQCWGPRARWNTLWGRWKWR